MGGRKSPFSITLAIGLYNSLYYRTSRDLCVIAARTFTDVANNVQPNDADETATFVAWLIITWFVDHLHYDIGAYYFVFSFAILAA